MRKIEKKIFNLKQQLSSCSTQEALYHHLISLGRALPPYPEELKTLSRQIPGCQSILYLDARLEENLLVFSCWADALISAGLAALLVSIYSEESPETILTTPPSFLAEFGILSQLTPSRSNGLAQIHRRMKQEAIKYFKPQPHFLNTL